MSDQLIGLRAALSNFIDSDETQSQSHIKRLHSHIAQRLVLEGGFNPDHIVPHPPFRIEPVSHRRTAGNRLIYVPDVADEKELTILGGLKTKAVDVVVTQRTTGPCLAISVKGTLNAFRNLTNRMEEAAGDCTNIHIAYPNLIYGFFHVLKANRAEGVSKMNDAAIDEAGNVVDSIIRYHDAMARLTGRRDVRNEVSRYEAVCLALVDTQAGSRGDVMETFPSPESVIQFVRFFDRLYEIYDLRYVYSAPAIRASTERMEWAADSPAFTTPGIEHFRPRIGVE